MSENKKIMNFDGSLKNRPELRESDSYSKGRTAPTGKLARKKGEKNDKV